MTTSTVSDKEKSRLRRLAASRRGGPKRRSTLDRVREVITRSNAWLSTRMIADRLNLTRHPVTECLIKLRDDEKIIETRKAMDDVADAESSFEWRKIPKRPAHDVEG